MKDDRPPEQPAALPPAPPPGSAPGSTPASPGADAATPAGLGARAAGFLRRKARDARLGAASLAVLGRDRLDGMRSARLRALGLAAPARLLGPVRVARRARPGRRWPAEAEALLVARSRGWDAAAPLFARLAGATPADRVSGPPARDLLRPAASAPVALATPVADRPPALPDDVAAGIVVYTAIFGAKRSLPPMFGPADRIRFLCLTDQALDPAPGWEIVPVPGGSDPVAATARAKILAHEALAGTGTGPDASLWLDPDRLLVGNLDTLIGRWLLPHDLVLWRHAAPGWHDLAEQMLVAGPAPDPARARAVCAQAAACAATGLDRATGAADTGMIWRRHGALRPGGEVHALMEAWWQAAEEAQGAEDLALVRARAAPAGTGSSVGSASGPETAPGAAAPAAVPRMLPKGLGTAADNLFTAHAPRNPVRRPAAPARPGGRRKVAFLYAAAQAKTASTFLRGEQLSAMVAAAWPDRYEVTYTDDAGSLRDAVVVLTKSAMVTRSPDDLAAIRDRNIAAIGCWDDIVPDPQKARIVDAHMTLSLRQTLEFNRIYPDTPAFFVTHHVNSQVPRCAPPMDRLRTGYFGDLGNTVRPESLSEMVELVGINTRSVNDSWLDALPRYNCHWIIRRKRSWDGWKPFLKGFVAARCGAVIVVTRDDGDAAHYLGDDYPFYAGSLDPAELEMTMARVAGAFGGPDWARAQAIMAQVAARNSDIQVCAEFRAMVDEITR